MKKKSINHPTSRFVMIELLVGLPVFFLLMWSLVQLMLYFVTSSTMQEVSIQAAKDISYETDKDHRNIKNMLLNRTELLSKDIPLITLFDDEKPYVSFSSKSFCEKMISKEEKEIICAFPSENGYGVSLKTSFKPIGSLLPSSYDFFSIKASSVSLEKEDNKNKGTGFFLFAIFLFLVAMTTFLFKKSKKEQAEEPTEETTTHSHPMSDNIFHFIDFLLENKSEITTEDIHKLKTAKEDLTKLMNSYFKLSKKEQKKQQDRFHEKLSLLSESLKNIEEKMEKKRSYDFDKISSLFEKRYEK